MPRYFIDTYDPSKVADEDGRELPNIAAVRSLVRRSLLEIVAEEAHWKPSVRVRAVVRDEAGEQVMSATMQVTTEWVGAGTQER